MSDRWVLTRGDGAWPLTLEDLEDPPERIFGIGSQDVLHESCISIIGARRASPYGLSIARLAGRVAAECGIVVVTGGAMGCDVTAARAALDAGGKTIVVAGTGADVTYPHSSRDVFARATTRGAVISLEAWGQTPRRYAFPKRNRIIAALSQSVLICEAGLRSGTFSTALSAGQMNRELYAVPGSIFSPESMGTNQLIADGAHVITSEIDLEQRISFDYGMLRMVGKDMPRQEGRILSALVSEPTRPDDLARYLAEPVTSILVALSDYEGRGVVKRLPDGRYSLSESAYLVRDKMVGRPGRRTRREA